MATTRILVFSTNTISDPGIDLAGSSHMSYSPGVMVISLPCTSGIRPSWIVHAIERGFDGVFIASDGDECAYLPDCSERASHIVAEAQQMLRAAGHDAQRLETGCDLLGVCRTVHALCRPVHRDAGQARTGANAGRGGLTWLSMTCSSSAPASAAWNRP